MDGGADPIAVTVFEDVALECVRSADSWTCSCGPEGSEEIFVFDESEANIACGSAFDRCLEMAELL
jgi:hypothetical protein